MINEVRLIGNVGSEPEVRTGAYGTMVRVSLATTDKWKNKKGDWEEKTQWHRIVAFGFAADHLIKCCRKGSLLYVAGSIEYGNYEKDGVKVYTTDIKAQRARVMSGFKDSGGESSGGGGYGGGGGYEPPPMGEDVPF